MKSLINTYFSKGINFKKINKKTKPTKNTNKPTTGNSNFSTCPIQKMSFGIPWNQTFHLGMLYWMFHSLAFACARNNPSQYLAALWLSPCTIQPSQCRSAVYHWKCVSDKQIDPWMHRYNASKLQLPWGTAAPQAGTIWFHINVQQSALIHFSKCKRLNQSKSKPSAQSLTF